MAGEKYIPNIVLLVASGAKTRGARIPKTKAQTGGVNPSANEVVATVGDKRNFLALRVLV